MDIKDLLKKYQALLIENDCLREEIKNLSAQLGPYDLKDSLTNKLISFDRAL
jgi:hypothetical protein